MGIEYISEYTNLNQEQRNRIIDDIMDQHMESLSINNVDIYDKDVEHDIEEYQQQIENLNDKKLIIRWSTNVAPWIESQGFDVNKQFEKLVNNRRVDYGFQY